MENIQRIRYFLFGQNFADGLRVTLTIITPALVFAWLGDLETGVNISLGSLLVSISDGPGPVVHKRNGMLFCNVIVFIMALLTGFLNTNLISMGILVLASTFFFSMFSVYGQRAGAIGTAALLVMILRMSRLIPGTEVLTHALFTLSGGVWYMLLSMLLYRLTPYRPVQRALGDCIYETAHYLEIKSQLYNPLSDLEAEYKKLIDQQVLVSQKQDAVRELLFKNRMILKEPTQYGRVLVVTFTYLVDMFENIMANWYDYSYLREKYKSTGILEEVQQVVLKIAAELKNIAEDVHSNDRYVPETDIVKLLEDLKSQIDAVPIETSTFTLKKILVNLRNLHEQIVELQKYFREDLSGKRKIEKETDFSPFVSHQRISPSLFFNSFTIKSSIFRHSLRVMITCGVGFVIAKLISTGHHSYWILLTIIVMLKPGYSLTKSKNFDRLMGTIGGGIIGVLLVGFIDNTNILFAVLVVCMILTYTFLRWHYIVAVIFMTPYVLIMFYFLGLGVVDIAGERLADTAIASLLAWLAIKFLLPVWESRNMQGYMAAVIKANIHYLQKLLLLLDGQKISTIDYKLVRKELFVSTANLSAALHRMFSEPRSRQLHRKEIYQFVVLNHVLSSNIASMAANLIETPQKVSMEIMQRVKRILSTLTESLQEINPEATASLEEQAEISESYVADTDAGLQQQLAFISRVSDDIKKLSGKLKLASATRKQS